MEYLIEANFLHFSYVSMVDQGSYMPTLITWFFAVKSTVDSPCVVVDVV